ncbi:MAG: DUF4417 domain-containing protein [Candidatus Saccharibacteria bacterium]|nr:DUF4417 domain-containing protein [Candidatus Saccharibacteria bacterium]
MSLTRNKQIDIFHADWVDGTTFCGDDEIPQVQHQVTETPEKMIPFSEAVKKKIAIDDASKTYVHFFEHDFKFWRFIRNPRKYFKRLRKFAGLISPDISLYLDMPLALQCYHVYLSRAITFFLQKNGFKVIPLIRWSDKRSYRFAFQGIHQQSTVCVSIYGGQKDEEVRKIFYDGFIKMIEIVKPSRILFYGSIAPNIKSYCEEKNIQITEYKPKQRNDKISVRKIFNNFFDLPLFK